MINEGLLVLKHAHRRQAGTVTSVGLSIKSYTEPELRGDPISLKEEKQLCFN